MTTKIGPHLLPERSSAPSLLIALPSDIINSIAGKYLSPKALSQLSQASPEAHQLVTSQTEYRTYTNSHSKLTYQSLRAGKKIPIEVLENFQPRDYSSLDFNDPEDKDYFESVSNGLNYNLREVNSDNFGVFYNRLSEVQKKYIISLQLPQNITNNLLLQILQECPNLEELSCWECDQITGVGFDRLPDGLELKKLIFSSCPITDANLLSLMQKCPNLEELLGF